jgi:hypothetical protein
MSWNINGQVFELCNCNFICPCWFDPSVTPDHGYCRSTWTFDIQEGQFDGVDLSGRRVVLLLGFENSIVEGNATVRLYIDSGASDEQQAALEAIYGGQRGGPMEAAGPLVSNALPTIRTEIGIDWGEQPTVKVGDYGSATTQPLHDPAGNPTRIASAAVMSMAAMSEGQPARPSNTSWTDPDLGEWDPRSSMILPFSWQA